MGYYRETENSTYGLKPIELYEFASNDNNWRYTSADQDITFGGNVYTATPIKREEIQQTEDVNKAALKVTFKKTNPLALQVLLNASDEIITLTIYRYHEDDNTDFAFYWLGRILGAEKETSGSLITLNCESIYSSIKRIGLQLRYTILCPVPIYSNKCGLTIGDWATAGTVASIASDKITLTIDVASNEDDGYFTAGVARFGAVSPYAYRHILYHAGTIIKIIRPVYGLEATNIVTIYPGCDKARRTCIDKFNNLGKFRGWPWPPDVNPFNGSSIV